MTEAGRAAIVTGAGTGIGRAVALALQADGYSVALVGRRREPLEAVAEELAAAGGSACVVAAAERIREEFGAIDVVVNNADITNLTSAFKPSR